MDEFYIFIHDGGCVTVSGNYTCDPDIVANLGENWEDYIAGKYVMLSKEQINFLNEHPESSIAEIFNMKESEEASLHDKESLINKIKKYDLSSAVNAFYVNDSPVWYSKGLRVSLSNSISKEKEAGKDTTTLWVNDTPYTVAVDTALQMLTDIELYAIACYNNTMNNIVKVKSMTLKSEIKTFDITKGYPEKLKFNL